MDAGNDYLRRVYVPLHNERFGREAAESGSAFVAYTGVVLEEVLCVHLDRQVGRDNCVSWPGRSLQIPGRSTAVITSRRWWNCVNIPTGGWRSLMARAAWPAMTPREGCSMKRHPMTDRLTRPAGPTHPGNVRPGQKNGAPAEQKNIPDYAPSSAGLRMIQIKNMEFSAEGVDGTQCGAVPERPERGRIHPQLWHRATMPGHRHRGAVAGWVHLSGLRWARA
jgi:hypothetical protein